MPAATSPASTRRTLGPAAGLALSLLVLLSGAGLHLLYLLNDCPLDLSGDEAHYWEWSRRLDWSYYSKGPLVAWIIAAGRWALADWSQATLGAETLAVRVPAILLSVATGSGLYVLAGRTTRRPAVALASVALLCVIPIFAVGAVLMTIDAPLACCYVWTLVACERGLRGAEIWPWLLAGVLCGVGLLAKYNMVFALLAVGLVILLDPRCRGQIRRPGPYVGAALGLLLGLAPIVVWNARHDWVSLRHVAGQAGVADGPRLNVLGPLTLVGGQLAVIGPVWFTVMVLAVWAALRRRPPASAGQALEPGAANLLLAGTLTPWGVFLLFSLITKVQPNWPVLGALPGAVLACAWLADLRRTAPRTARATIAAGVLLGLTTVVLIHYSHWLYPVLTRLAPPDSDLDLTPMARVDPTSRLRGWAALGQAVGRVWQAERAAGRDPFIVADDYQLASQIAFYTPGAPRLYCLQAVLGDRQSQYDLWPNPIRDPAAFAGRRCIYIGARHPELFEPPPGGAAVLGGARLAETVEHRVRGRRLQIWTIYTVDKFTRLPPELVQRMGSKF
jgi:4-amino-4-deoxy-L-arabinose transferase-like glycosyltransferase